MHAAQPLRRPTVNVCEGRECTEAKKRMNANSFFKCSHTLHTEMKCIRGLSPTKSSRNPSTILMFSSSVYFEKYAHIFGNVIEIDLMNCMLYKTRLKLKIRLQRLAIWSKLIDIFLSSKRPIGWMINLSGIQLLRKQAPHFVSLAHVSMSGKKLIHNHFGHKRGKRENHQKG